MTEEGKSPLRHYLLALRDARSRAKIRVRLNRIRLGNFGDVKSVGDGVSEIRIPHGPGYRIYFAHTGDAIVILLCAGDKSTQKHDIRNAKNYWLDYKRRL